LHVNDVLRVEIGAVPISRHRPVRCVERAEFGEGLFNLHWSLSEYKVL
jgi:hypothetical protein